MVVAISHDQELLIGCSSYQSGTKPNLVANILATKFGSLFCDIYNALKNMFNTSLIIM